MPFSANVPSCGCIQSYRGTRRYLEVILIRSKNFWTSNIPRLLGFVLLIAAIAAAIIAGVMLLTDDNTAEPLVTTNTTAATAPATSGTLPPATGLVSTEATSDTTTDAASDTTTEPTSDVTTEPTSETTTDETSETTTAVTSETVTDETSETTADVTSDTTSESTSDTTIEYSETQSSVEISVDGETLTISTNAANVATVLYEAGVHLGPIDEVSPDRSSAVYDGLRIRVVRVEIMRYPIEVEIDFETERVETDELYVGTEEVATEGVPGIKRVIYEQTLRDGMLWQNDVVSSEITQEPLTKVVRVGTKPVPTTEATTTTVTTTTRATTTTTTTRATTRATTPATTTKATTRATTTPATTTKPPTTATTPPTTTATTPPTTTATTPPPTTETTPPTTSATTTETTATTETSPTTEQTTTQSEPEQQTVTIDGKVYKVKKVIQGEAVSYYSNNPHPLTYSGNPAIPGKTVAVDRSVIPLGSMLYVTALDGTAWTYGPAYAHDIGGGIKGNIVDLFRENYDACVAHGRRKCYIYIIEP